ncbi:helix-hairpin-helix domain-containing protein, partial [uncultured Corynebacterium sp.]|uniref:ComEA family DNA-binding protein n=1 Tax=uncultured Corynebacterium sp. TaxID=159447 RepID=UPI002634600A
ALDHAQPLPEAELLSLNLAQVVADGQQIVVLNKGEAPPDAPGDAGGGISVNTASAEELTELPGVGEATAAAIIAHRESIGSFTDIEQLLDVKGIGPAKFESLKDAVSL